MASAEELSKDILVAWLSNPAVMNHPEGSCTFSLRINWMDLS
jgi:hypothetical protein